MSTHLSSDRFLIPSERTHKIYSARVVENKPAAQNQWSIWVKTDDGFPDFLPGNFCMLSLSDLTDPLTPRPFAIVEKKDGMYQFIYRVVGKFTRLLANIPVGTKLGVLGPLGKGFLRSHFKSGKHLFVSGGVGFASILPSLDELSRNNLTPVANFYGVRTDLEVIRRGKFKADLASDDGSVGFKGRLPELIKSKPALLSEADFIYVCGPTPMMTALFEILPPEKTFYYLEETMGCGVGICIGCVVSIKNENNEVRRVRSCMEGPVFRGSQLQPWRETVCHH